MIRSMKILGTLLLFILIFAFSQFGAVELVTWLCNASVGEVMSDSLGFMLTYVVAMSIALLLVSVWSRLRGVPAGKIECSKAGFSPTYILLGVVLLVALSVVLLPLSEMLPADGRNIPRGGWTILAVILFAPIFEEFLFRVKLYDMLLRDVTPFWAVMLSSLCFGVVHLEPIVAIEAAISGVIFSYFYIQRRSIFSAIILHMINNAFAYLILMVKYQGRTALDFVSDIEFFGIVYAVSVVIVLFAAVKIVRRLRKQKFLLAYLSAEEVAAIAEQESQSEEA